jgi:hypothetical protein
VAACTELLWRLQEQQAGMQGNAAQQQQAVGASAQQQTFLAASRLHLHSGLCVEVVGR